MSPGLARELGIRPQKAAGQPLVEACPGTMGLEGASHWRAWGRSHVGPSWLVHLSGQQQKMVLLPGWAQLRLHPEHVPSVPTAGKVLPLPPLLPGSVVQERVLL